MKYQLISSYLVLSSISLAGLLLLQAPASTIPATLIAIAGYLLSYKNLSKFLEGRTIQDKCEWRTDLKFLIPLALTIVIQDNFSIALGYSLPVVILICGIIGPLSKIDIKKSMTAARNQQK